MFIHDASYAILHLANTRLFALVKRLPCLFTYFLFIAAYSVIAPNCSQFLELRRNVSHDPV